MVYAETLSQPSIFDLARSGDLKAISYLINSYLQSEGIFARVAPPDHKGCLPVLVEFQQEPIADRIIRYICHLVWKINAPNLEGVQIAARYVGDADILWKQSVRIVTPANRLYRQQTRAWQLDWGKFKTLRLFFMMGSAVASFVIGCWVSYYEVAAQRLPLNSPVQENVVMTGPPPKRPDTVQAVLEVVPVIQHQDIPNPNDPTVTLMFGGDVTLSDHFEEVIGTNYSLPFAQLPEYQTADVAMVNLENPLTRSTLRRPDKQFNFKAAPEAVKVLTEGGIDIVNLANNHTMDYEEPGLVETIETLDKAGIHSIGAGRDIKEARRPEILEVKGQRIAYLGYYDADFHAADDGVAGTNPRYDQRVAADIRAIRDQVDWIVVNYHWGAELAEYPGDWQIDLGRYTIDQGADLVVGHHPHVLQGAEIYKGRPIVYSLGNFIFGGNSRTDYDTAVLKVGLNNNRQMKVEFLPVEVKQYQARVVPGKPGEEILRRVERLSQIFDQPMQSVVVLDAPKRESKMVKAPRVSQAQPNQPTAPEGEGQLFGAPMVPQAGEGEGQLFGAPMVPQKEAEEDSAPGSEELVSGPELSSEESEVETPDPSPVSSRLETAADPKDELKPYIEQPFIKDPFISLPSLPQVSVPHSQSYNGANSSISFKIAIPEKGATKEQAVPKEPEGNLSRLVMASSGHLKLPLS